MGFFSLNLQCGSIAPCVVLHYSNDQYSCFIKVISAFEPFWYLHNHYAFTILWNYTAHIFQLNFECSMWTLCIHTEFGNFKLYLFWFLFDFIIELSPLCSRIREYTASISNMNETIGESVDLLNISEDDSHTSNYTYIYDYQDSLDWLPLNEVIPCVTFYIIIGLFGISGNSLVIVVILAFPRTRNITNLFLLSLASADLLLVLVCVPIKVWFLWLFGYNCITF